MSRNIIFVITDSIWNKKELPDQWKEYITVPIYKKGDKTDRSNYCGISVTNIIQNFIQCPPLQVKSTDR
jgi:hypothetical protein